MYSSKLRIELKREFSAEKIKCEKESFDFDMKLATTRNNKKKNLLNPRVNRLGM